MIRNQVTAVFVAIIGIIFFSAKAVLVKLAYAYNIPPISLLLLRMSFSLPVYVVVALWSNNKGKNGEAIKGKEYLWLLALGFVGYYLASLFDFLGLQYIKASLERIILFVYPTLVLFISWLIFKKPPTKLQMIAILLSYAGIVITFSEELSITDHDAGVLIGGVLVFLSALAYASYLVGSGYLIPKLGPILFTSYAMIVSCACVIVHYLFVHQDDITAYPAAVYGLSFIMAMVSTVIPSYMISYAIKHLGASNFSILGSLGPVSTIVLAHIFLDESLTLIQLAGTTLVIVGVVVISRQKNNS